MTKKLRTDGQWKQIHRRVLKAQAKGTSVDAYLEKAGISTNSYYQARARLSLSSQNVQRVKKAKQAKKHKGEFVRFVPDSQTGIKVSLPSGAVISVGRNDTEGLRTVLRVLGEE